MIRFSLLAAALLTLGAIAGCDSSDGAAATTCPDTPCTGGQVCVAGVCTDGGATTCPTGFVRIEPGSFQMGSPTDETFRGDDETIHTVTLTRAFCMKTTEVTQAEFEAVAGYNPSYYTDCGGTCPVEDVRWMEAATYLNALSRRDGLAECYACTGTMEDFSLRCEAVGDPYACAGYRLPTEAEWEYAARAGATTAFTGGAFDLTGFCEAANLDPYGWFCGNADNKTHPVATKQANAWGLYDMQGNVFEWCEDGQRTYAGDVTDPHGGDGERVIRGGAYDQNPEYCRLAYRDVLAVGYAVENQGFRTVLTLR